MKKEKPKEVEEIMSTEEYIQKLEKDVKRLEIRMLTEEDPVEKDSIQKRIENRSKTIKTLQKLWKKDGVQYATLEPADDKEE